MDKGIDAMIERYLPDAAIESPNLSYIEKKILAVLLFKWDNYSKAQDSGVIITSNDSLCREARISKRDLVFFRQVLIAKGLIKVPQVGKQCGDGSHYIVNYDALEEPIPAMKKIDKERFKKKPSKPLETPMGTVYINTKINTDTNTNIKAKAKADIEPTLTPTLTVDIEPTLTPTLTVDIEPTLTPTLTVEGNPKSQKRIVILKKEEEIPNYLLEIAEAINSLELFDTWKKVLGDIEKEKNKDNLLKLQQVIDNFDFLDVENKESYKKMIDRILNPTTTNNSNLGTVGLFEQEDDLPF